MAAKEAAELAAAEQAAKAAAAKEAAEPAAAEQAAKAAAAEEAAEPAAAEENADDVQLSPSFTHKYESLMSVRQSVDGTVQNGNDCLFSALQLFPSYAQFSIQQLRDEAAIGILDDQLVPNRMFPFAGMSRHEYAAALRRDKWGSNLVLHVLANRVADVYVIQRTRQKCQEAFLTRYGAPVNGNMGHYISAACDLSSSEECVVELVDNVHYKGCVFTPALVQPTSAGADGTQAVEGGGSEGGGGGRGAARGGRACGQGEGGGDGAPSG